MKYIKLYEKYRFEKQSLIIERSIEVGDNLMTKLNKINSPLSKKLTSFLNSGDIKDDVRVTKIDFDDDDNKVFTLTDEKGEERKFKFGKLLKYLGYTDEIKGYETENFISNFKKSDVTNLELLKGKDILKAYHCNNYDDSKGHGNLFASCMRFERAQKFLEIYTANPNQVACLTLINPTNKRIQGRALVWKLDNGNYFMDRIYTVSKELESVFKKYAHDNNFETGSNPSDEITLKVGGDFEYYPYMDTFQYYTPEMSLLSANNGDLSLTSTEGGGGSGDTVWSEYMQEEIEREEATFSEKMGDWIYTHDAVDFITNIKIDDKGKVTYDTDYHIPSDIHEISFVSYKYMGLEGERAHIDDLITLENDEDEYVLRDDEDVYVDDAYGVYVKGDEIRYSDFMNNEIDLFAIEVTHKESGEYENYIPYDLACYIWNKKQKDFVIANIDEVINMGQDVTDDYDKDESYTDLHTHNTQKTTESVWIPKSFLKDENETLSILSNDAPIYMDILEREYEVKKNVNYIELHDGIYLDSESITKHCTKTKSGYKIFPPLITTNYDSYDKYLTSIYKSIKSAKETGHDDADYMKSHKYFLKAFEKGSLLENNLLRSLKDKKLNTIIDFKSASFIMDNSNMTVSFAYLQTYLRKGIDFPWSSNIFEMKREYASWLSYYNHDDIRIYPFAYAPESDKYLVYREGDYRMYNASEIMNLVRFNAI